MITFVFIFNKPKEQTITKEFYKKFYDQQSTWSINQFPDANKSYSGADFSWGWSYVGNSLIDMYKATGDKKYLEIFVNQAEYIFTQTDEQLGIESFSGSGLSLPAWSDRGRYTSGEFNYTYPVHTGMITVPILRFVDEVKSNKLEEYKGIADSFLQNTGEALAIHNQDNMWVDFSETEGFYIGHSYGVGIVSEAGKIGVPNRISIYLAAAGLYDKLTDGSIYTKRIEKSLNYFKYSLMKYDEEYDSYYWSYWEEDILGKPWEDISHAQVTAYGLFLLHEEAGFSIFSNDDFEKIANNVYKVIKNENGLIKTRKYIHERDEEEKVYYLPAENEYYYDILRWSFLGLYDKDILTEIENMVENIKIEEMNPQTRLASIAAYLYAKNAKE
ncbi:hypothetical protein [Oceanobacillus profundus]|uniref:hypothetical protein n=1 Tax=Oceanobacillus profundus TaxID=372463 RepID=UPI0036D3C3F2